MWHFNIRVHLHKSALFLCVQEITRVSLLHTVTQRYANEFYDNIMLPDCKIIFHKRADVIGHHI